MIFFQVITNVPQGFLAFLIGKHVVVGFYLEHLRVPEEGQLKNP